ncbi:MAG: hypothetical protein AB8G95_26905 [Anaerolineae bacterium]
MKQDRELLGMKPYFRNLVVLPLTAIVLFVFVVCIVSFIGLLILTQPSLRHEEFCGLLNSHIENNTCMSESRTDALRLAFPVGDADKDTVYQAIGEFKGSSRETNTEYIERYRLKSPIALGIFGETYWEFRYDKNGILLAIEEKEVSLTEG